MEELCLCYDCRVKKGYKRIEGIPNTAKVKKCKDCGKRRTVAPNDGWEFEYPNGMCF